MCYNLRMHSSPISATRRGFLKGGLLAAAAFPFIGHARGLNGRATLALIGAGKQGRGLLHSFLGQDLVVTAVCDCDRARREDRARVVNDYYAQRAQLGVPGTVCRAVADFREVLADPSVDMVCIATPDHWHAYMAVEAMKAGKDVYCEKPLVHTVEEARLVMEASAKTGRILQTGAMQRSGLEFRTACEIVRNGFIGRVKLVDANFGGPSRPHRDYENPDNAAAEGAPNPDVDFDMWCGPAPLAKYSDRLAPRGVHGFFPMFWRYDDWFGLGMCGDWGAHHLDIAQWGLGCDETGPVKVVRSDVAPSKGRFDGGRRQRGAQLVFADGCVVRHAPFTGSDFGTVFYGEEGIVAVNRGRLAVWRGKGVSPDQDLQARLNDGSFDGMERVAFWNSAATSASASSASAASGRDRSPNGPRGDGRRPSDRSLLDAVNKATKAFRLKKAPVKLYKALGHPADFVDCFRSRRQPCSHAGIGARSAILSILCNLSYVHDTGFGWDPAKNVFADGTGDARWLAKDYRGDWKVRL